MFGISYSPFIFLQRTDHDLNLMVIKPCCIVQSFYHKFDYIIHIPEHSSLSKRNVFDTCLYFVEPIQCCPF